MYKLSFKPSNNQAISTLLLIALLVIVPLSFGLTSTVTVFDSKSTQENLYDQSDQFKAEMEEIVNLDFNDQPEISQELRENIAITMSGFNAGFREKPNLASESKYLLSSPQMDIQFSQSQVQLRIPNYDRTLKTNDLTSPDQRIDLYPDYNSFEKRMIDDRGQSMGPKLIGYTIATLEFVGSNPVQPIAEDPSASYFNYFYGSDPDNWIVNVPSYQKLLYKNLYDKIDLVYSLNEGQLKYDFYVYPGGSYEEIQLRWDGPVSLQQSSEGLRILISTQFEGQSFVDSNPINFLGADRNEKVLGAFRLISDSSYGFSMQDHDRSEVLIIDPLIKFSTFLGGSGEDKGYSVAVDDSGNVYITGYTDSADFAIPFGAYDETYNGGSFDVFVTKLAADGSTLLYSTFLGGSSTDAGYAMAVDVSGNVYISGKTASTNFPTTPGAYAEILNVGNYDMFVSKLAASGSTLLYSTFIGGSSYDYGYSLKVDDSGSVSVTGITNSADFPTTTGAYAETSNGGTDAFVSRLSTDGSTLLFSTFIGGSGAEVGEELMIDGSGNVYITGRTGSTNFPTTAGAYDETYNQNGDVFVSKLVADGSTLLFSTFIGGSDLDWGVSLAVDDNGDVYITGRTRSTDFPTILGSGAYDRIPNGGFDAFVAKLTNDGSTLIYTTFLGGTGEDRGYSLEVDSTGDVYITGWTSSPDFPTTFGAYDVTHNGGSIFDYDVFVSKLAGNGTILLYSSFIGSSVDDFGFSLAIDTYDNIYITGKTDDGATDLPTTFGAYDETPNGGMDVFVTKLRLSPNPPFNIQSMTKTSGDGSSIFLFWDKPDYGASPITSFKVYRGTSEGVYSYLGSSPGSRYYFNDASVIENLSYYYVVTAVNKYGESIFSSELYAAVQPTELTTETETSVITDTETSIITETEVETSTTTTAEIDTSVSNLTETEKTYFPILPVVMLILILPIIRRRLIKN